MREYKFRGISQSPLIGDSNFMIGNSVYINYEDKFAYINDMPVVFETVGQYTGLKDENGKEIYEGDIWETDGILYTVEFSEGRAGIYPFASDDGCGCCSYDLYSPCSGKVIGNVYENPELLEVME